MYKQFFRFAAIAFVLAFSGCFFDSDDKPSAVSSSSTISSSSVPLLKKARLSINDPKMKKVVIDAPSNVILSRDLKADSTFGEYEVVTINWGTFEKQNYDFTYYLYSTEGAVRIDSVTFNDSLTYVNKYITGNLITDKVGMTGDGILPVRYIGDSDVVNNVTYKRFHKRSFDSTITMIVYATDTTTKLPTKLVVNYAIKQNVKSAELFENKFELFSFEKDSLVDMSFVVKKVVDPANGIDSMLAVGRLSTLSPVEGDFIHDWDYASFVDNKIADTAKVGELVGLAVRINGESSNKLMSLDSLNNIYLPNSWYARLRK